MKAFIAILICATCAVADKLDAVSNKRYGTNIPDNPLELPSASNDDLGAVSNQGYGKNIPDNPLELPSASNDDLVRVAPPQEPQEEETTMDPLKMLMMVVPGTPGVDYPILDTIPDTSFSCDSVATAPFGYYADTDPASRCQVFHVCNDNIKSSFLCHNGSIFNQQAFVCDWWFNVNCEEQKNFYGLNKDIGVTPLPANPVPVEQTNGNGNSGSSSANANANANASSASESNASASANNGLLEGASQQEAVIAEPEDAYLPPADTYLPPSNSYLPPY